MEPGQIDGQVNRVLWREVNDLFIGLPRRPEKLGKAQAQGAAD